MNNTIWLYWGAREAWTSRRSLEEGKLFFPFEDVNIDFSLAGNETLISLALEDLDPPLTNPEFAARSIDLLTNGMKPGDWIIIPGKFQTLYHMGEIQGDYAYEFDADYGLHHSRKVDWFVRDVPASALPMSLITTITASLNEPLMLEPKQSLEVLNGYKMAVGF